MTQSAALDTPAASTTPTASPGERHVRLSARPTLDFSDLREAWQFRELFWVLALRDIKVRYKQTLAGVAWVVLEPVIKALIFTVVFSGLAGMTFGEGGGPYILGVFAAVTGYNLFSNALLRGSMALVTNNQLVRKIYFPRILMPLSAVTSAIVDWLISVGLLVALLLGCNALAATTTNSFAVTWPGWWILLWPVTALVFILIATGLSAATAGLAAIYRDVNKIVPTLVQLAMYATPVMYDLDYADTQLPGWARAIYYANPLTGVTAAYRYCVTGMGSVNWPAFIWSAVFGVACTIIGYFMFRRHERGVADVI